MTNIEIAEISMNAPGRLYIMHYL